MTADEIIRAILSDRQLLKIKDKIQSGKGTFEDTAKYSNRASELLGKYFSESVLDISEHERVEACTKLLNDRYDDINTLLDTTQRSIDSKSNLQIKPQHAEFDIDRAVQIGESLIDKTVPDSTIVRRAGSAPVTMSRSMHDDYIKANAEFRSRAGLKCYITRVSDNEPCKWCTRLAGRYEYGQEPDDVYRRHDNCGCTVTYESGRERQNVWTKKKWAVPDKEAGAEPPKVFTREEAQRLNNEHSDALSRNKVDIADNAKTVEKVSAVEETSGFKQAKTIEEAEKFALENGVRHVNYSDLPLETANLLNEAAMTLPKDIRPAYIGSGKSVQKVTGKKFSRKEKEYYGVHMDVLQMHFGEYPNIEYDFEGGNVVGISTAYKTPEKIHKSKVEGNKAYAEKHDGHTQFFNEDGRSTAFHEMGHIYAEKKGVPEGFAEDAERWLKESKCDMLKSTDEAWAEAWGAYHTKNPDLPGYIAEYVENATNTPMKIDYMSNSFRPKYSDSITDISIGDISISTKQVENSKFDLVTEVSEGRRSKAVRLAEKNLKEVQKYLPDNFELPKIAVIDFDEYGLNKDAIGGYHAQSGVMFLNSKFDTTAKVLQYVNAQKGQFANTTELAPILHELGHKYYEDCVKSLAKEQKIGYNNAKEIIDSKIQSFIYDNIPNEISKVISKYADNGYKKHKYTELVAECFSVRNSNDTADKLISLLKGEKTI